MSNYRRLFLKGGTFFFTVVTFKRSLIFDQKENVDLLKNCFQATMVKYPFTIEAIVVLPDHLHAIWTLPERESNYSVRWQLIKRAFSRLYSESITRNIPESMLKKKEKGIWQRRFWEHAIQSQADFNKHCDYIHFNPVKHGLVGTPDEWQYSSFKKFVSHGLYPENWGQGVIKELEEMDMDYE